MIIRRQINGFTLLEILVSISIFAIISVIALTGLKTIIDAQEITNKVADQMKELQSTMFYLEQDIRFAINREIRDEFGDTRPAVLAGNTGITGLSLTRAGLRNPLGLSRSNMIRVHYRLRDNALMRSQYRNLDRRSETDKFERQLMSNVDDLEFRFLDSNHQWVNFWPPVKTQGSQTNLPKAIEITISQQYLGKITRLISLPGS